MQLLEKKRTSVTALNILQGEAGELGDVGLCGPHRGHRHCALETQSCSLSKHELTEAQFNTGTVVVRNSLSADGKTGDEQESFLRWDHVTVTGTWQSRWSVVTR